MTPLAAMEGKTGPSTAIPAKQTSVKQSTMRSTRHREEADMLNTMSLIVEGVAIPDSKLAREITEVV
jgi:hypothetical protein